MSRIRRRRLVASVAVSVGAIALIATSMLPAHADTLPAADCVTSCTATFDTVGNGFTFDVPAGISELTATISGGAGAAPAFALTIFPDAVGGAGGVTTVDLGTTYAGEALIFGVGGTGEGSYVMTTGQLPLGVAGGGGGGGYIGRLDLPDQIFGTFPGGDGASPIASGITAGGDATAFGGDAANGLGGTFVGNASFGGAGGTGTANGTAGGDTSTATLTELTLAVGGAGGAQLIDATNHVAGSGGSGVSGGGGGAVTTVDAGDEITNDLVAPGGGGAGYLAPTLTAVAGTPNTGTGEVSFTWSLTPPAAVLPVTGATTPVWIPWLVLLLVGAGLIAARGRRTAG